MPLQVKEGVSQMQAWIPSWNPTITQIIKVPKRTSFWYRLASPTRLKAYWQIIKLIMVVIMTVQQIQPYFNMTLQPTNRHNYNSEGIKKMNDIFDSMYDNLLRMNTNKQESSVGGKQETAESNLLDAERYQDTVKKGGQEEQDYSIDGMVQGEADRLRRELERKESIIRSLQQQLISPSKKPSGNSVQELQKQVKFLSQNNQTLYRNTYKLQQDIARLREELSQKTRSQSHLQKRVAEYQKQITFLRKLNKDLLSEQKDIVKGQQKDVDTFRVVKNQFEKEKELLNGKLKLVEIERENDLKDFRKSLNKSVERYMSNKPVHQNNQSPVPKASFATISVSVRPQTQVQIMKNQIQKLKQSVNQLSNKKHLPRKKSMSSTPLKKPRS